MHELTEWDSFYVILGSAAGALIGLQFVVMTLIAERPPKRAAEGSSTFATPTTIYFSAVLLITALVRVPWTARWQLSASCALVGFIGMMYVAIVIRKMVIQQAYQPVVEDWAFHALVPFIAFAAMAVAGVELNSYFLSSTFAIAGAVLLLLFTGIHNAWDAVVFHVVSRRKKEGTGD
jgi:hypothetical protein